MPSPIDHTTCTGTAVAVTVTVGTLADADRDTDHQAGSTHNQVGNITSCGAEAGGFTTTSGRGNTNRDAAIRPNAARPGACGSGNHTTSPATPDGVRQVRWYHAPGPVASDGRSPLPKLK